MNHLFLCHLAMIYSKNYFHLYLLPIFCSDLICMMQHHLMCFMLKINSKSSSAKVFVPIFMILIHISYHLYLFLLIKKYLFDIMSKIKDWNLSLNFKSINLLISLFYLKFVNKDFLLNVCWIKMNLWMYLYHTSNYFLFLNFNFIIHLFNFYLINIQFIYFYSFIQYFIHFTSFNYFFPHLLYSFLSFHFYS